MRRLLLSLLPLLGSFLVLNGTVAQAQEKVPQPRLVTPRSEPQNTPFTALQEPKKNEEKKDEPRKFPFPKPKAEEKKAEEKKEESDKKDEPELPPLKEPKKEDSKKDEPKKEAEKKEEPKKEAEKKDEPKKEAEKKDDPEIPPVKKVEPELPPLKTPKEEAKKEEGKKAEPNNEEPKAEEKKDEPKDPEWKKDLDALKAELTTGGIATATQRGDNAWLLTASALVLLMTPGLALFYGGMVRRKNILATIMQSYASMAIVGVYWVAFGYGLAFGPSVFTVNALGVTDGGVIGWDWKLFFLQGVNPTDMLPGYNIPVLTHVMFQGMFAIITPALISGAIAERIRFWPWTIFMILWVTVVYCPLAHMVWAWDWFAFDPFTPGKDPGGSPIGLLGKLGALDFAGGTVVHIAAGFGGLACSLVLRRRYGYPANVIHPSSMVITLLGAGLLWFGWFGFNGGSGLNSSDLGATGFATTQAAAAAAGLSWITVEWIFKGKPTALGLASGIVAGLVAVTPAAGYVYVWGGAAIGLLAGIVCYFAVQLKSLLGYDDSLDAFGVHGIGGFLGAVLTGFFCYAAVQSASADGFFAHKGFDKAIVNLKKEAESLKTEIQKIESEKSATEKKIDEDYAAKLKEAKDDAAKETLKTEAETAKAEIGKKVDRRKARIEAIESKKDEKVPDSKDGEIAAIEGKIAGYKDAEKNGMTQPMIQIKASIFSAVLAFVVSLVLAILVQIMTLGNFTTTQDDETVGLDRTEHGEVGFDFGVAGESLSTSAASEPRPAKVPPGAKRFDIVVDGIDNGGLMHAWNELCQPAQEGKPVDADFKAIYPYVTTVQGNRFRFRGGDAKTLAAHFQRLFMKKLGKRDLKVRIEE